MAKKVDFILNEPLEFSINGGKQEEQALVLHAPNAGSASTKEHARKLKVLGFEAFRKAQAIAEVSGVKKPEEKKDEKPEENIELLDLFYWAGVDIHELCQTMGALAPSVVKIGESGYPFKQSHWDSLDMEDQERLTGVYLQSFLMRSGSSTQK